MFLRPRGSYPTWPFLNSGTLHLVLERGHNSAHTTQPIEVSAIGAVMLSRLVVSIPSGASAAGGGRSD